MGIDSHSSPSSSEVIAMRRHIARLLALVATPSLAILWLVSAPPASAGDPCYHGFEMPTTTIEATNEIKLMPCAFGPTVARVPVGSTVTFFNGPDFAHLVTGADQAWGSRDTEVRPRGTVSYTFDTPGVYPYACALHRGMSGTIVVGDVVPANAVGGAGAGTATTVTPTAGQTTAGTVVDGPVALALTVAIGIVIGAAGAVLALRRRGSHEEPSSPQAA
jgi:plastocyanin